MSLSSVLYLETLGHQVRMKQAALMLELEHMQAAKRLAKRIGPLEEQTLVSRSSVLLSRTLTRDIEPNQSATVLVILCTEHSHINIES